MRSKNYNVRQVTVDTAGNSKSMTKGSSLRIDLNIEKKTNSTYEKSLNYERSKEKPSPCCFLYARFEIKHFLENARSLELAHRKINAGSCLMMGNV